MKNLVTRTLYLSAMVLLGSIGLLWSGDLPWSKGSFVSSAEARIGRPLTPMSYAGVARRTTRRAVAYGAAVAAPRYYAPPPPVVYGGAPPPPPAVYAPACYQAVDPYGRVYTRCP